MDIHNGHLIVFGKRVDETDITAFTTAEQMTEWELGGFGDGPNANRPGIYEVLDPNEQHPEIDTLDKVVGPEFAEAFYAHKDRLIARSGLPEALKDLREAYRRYRAMEATAGGESLSMAEMFS